MYQGMTNFHRQYRAEFQTLRNRRDAGFFFTSDVRFYCAASDRPRPIFLANAERFLE